VAQVADAQMRSGRAVSGTPGWWFSAGAGAMGVGDIADGASNTRWRFLGDPRWVLRGTLEKSLDGTSSLGLAAAYGVIDVNVVRLRDDIGPVGLPPSCPPPCDAQSQFWSAMLQFRSGGNNGFHTVFEAAGGLIALRDFRARVDRSALADLPSSLNPAGSLGFGFGYAMGRDFAITLVQDGGIAFHSKEALPENTGRTWRTRTTKAELRFGFGRR
jgi:hypothetical protein